MQTLVNVDSALLQRVIVSSGAVDADSAVEEALFFYLGVKDQTSIRRLRGQIEWDGIRDED